MQPRRRRLIFQLTLSLSLSPCLSVCLSVSHPGVRLRTAPATANQNTDTFYSNDVENQEAQLSPRDRAMRRVNRNLANCHATVQKLLIRQVLTKSMV